jgi:hypothetical protein
MIFSRFSFAVHFRTPKVPQTTDYDWQIMNRKLVARKWLWLTEILSRNLSRAEQNHKNLSVNITNVLAKIITQYRSNTSLDHCFCINFLSQMGQRGLRLNMILQNLWSVPPLPHTRPCVVFKPGTALNVTFPISSLLRVQILRFD